MSRQGLHRRRGHKYRSATAIFPADAKGLVGGLGREPGVWALGEERRVGKGRERERTKGL